MIHVSRRIGIPLETTFTFRESFDPRTRRGKFTAGCSSSRYNTQPVVRTGTVRTPTLRQMESLNMDRGAPILIRIYKEENKSEVWKQDRTGKFALLKSYPICKFSGKLGPKIAQGDYQAPEGFYDVTPEQMNPYSSQYLAFDTGYPKLPPILGRTGSLLMVQVAANRSAATHDRLSDGRDLRVS